jgi:hypothetical protein
MKKWYMDRFFLLLLKFLLPISSRLNTIHSCVICRMAIGSVRGPVPKRQFHQNATITVTDNFLVLQYCEMMKMFRRLNAFDEYHSLSLSLSQFTWQEVNVEQHPYSPPYIYRAAE